MSQDDLSSVFSFTSYVSQSSSSKPLRSKHLKFHGRLVTTLQRWSKRHHQPPIPNSPGVSPSSRASNSSDTTLSYAVSEPAESLVSSMIRDRHQFAALVCAQSDAASSPEPHKPGVCHRVEQTQEIHGVLQRYIDALELAELESRSDARGPFQHRTVEERKGVRGLGREKSMYDPNRRMRLIYSNPLVPSYHRSHGLPVASEEDSRLGFGHLPDQMHRKAVKKGFNFTLMVVGESGLGKSTLINSMFMQDLYKDREVAGAAERIRSTTQIEKRQIELDERGVKLRLTVVDTPGFNDAVDCTDCWKPIESYIDETFEQYFKDECGLNRKNIHDHRVHCCLYFISPFGHGLRQVDVEFMRRLQYKVNIVPIIAKADALTSAELRAFKERIMADFDRYKINIYRLPECDSDEEEEIKRLDKEIKSVLPFAVIGSNCVIEMEGGKRARGRQYPWGVAEVENTRHCDFTKLRIFLLKTHMQDLKDMTLDVHYENYRAKYITERMSKRHSDRREVGPTLEFELEPLRTDRENGPGFEALVDQDGLLKQKEEEPVDVLLNAMPSKLQRMQQMVSRMQEQMKRSAAISGGNSSSSMQNSGSAIAPMAPTSTNNL
uniref:Septin-5 n=1 Tax=Cryptocotyle lingua TaxID=66766 RepID=A0A7U0TI88_9TREM|nr:septin-5 [Cryptocotyle lingua]